MKSSLVVTPVGSHTVAWEGIDTNGHVAPSAFYDAEVTAGGVRKVQRVVLVR